MLVISMKDIKKKSYFIKVDTTELIAGLSSNAISLRMAIASGKKDDIALAIIPFINVFSCFDIKNSKEQLLFKYIKNTLKSATCISLSIIDKGKLNKFNKLKIKNQLMPIENVISIETDFFFKTWKLSNF